MGSSWLGQEGKPRLESILWFFVGKALPHWIFRFDMKAEQGKLFRTGQCEQFWQAWKRVASYLVPTISWLKAENNIGLVYEGVVGLYMGGVPPGKLFST